MFPRLSLSWMFSTNMLLEVLLHGEGFLTEIAIIRIYRDSLSLDSSCIRISLELSLFKSSQGNKHLETWLKVLDGITGDLFLPNDFIDGLPLLLGHAAARQEEVQSKEDIVVGLHVFLKLEGLEGMVGDEAMTEEALDTPLWQHSHDWTTLSDLFHKINFTDKTFAFFIYFIFSAFTSF